MGDTRDDHRDRAVRLLRHYLERATVRAGGKWGHDNDVEVCDIVDDIIAAARVSQLSEYATQVEALIGKVQTVHNMVDKALTQAEQALDIGVRDAQ